MRRLNLVGQKYGLITVIKDMGSRNKKSIFLIKCECGNEKIAQGCDLRRGNYKSCGCKKGKEQTTKEFRDHPLYDVWKGMRARCNNKNHDSYKNYGGRGIKVCDRWNDFRLFYADVIDGYKPGLQLDRDNNDGDYQPNNCIWRTHKMNGRHTRQCKLTEEKAMEILMSADRTGIIAKKYNITPASVRNIKKGRTWA